MNYRVRWIVLVWVVLWAACDSPAAPTPLPAASPLSTPVEVVCPANLSREAPDGRPLPIAYSPPTLMGQSIPKVTCSPASGALFPAGATTRVNCDFPVSPELTASCSFTVTVVIPPQLSVTRFMAFGDSITEGFLLCDPCPGTFGSAPLRSPFDLVGGRAGASIFIHPQPEKSYPSRLQALLAATYAVQQVSVLNRGIGGERAAQGKLRLLVELTMQRPEALLLFEGVNDINLALTTAPGQRVSVLPIRDDLRAIVQTALASNVNVMLATLTPIASSGSHADPLAAEAVIRLNQEIRGLAAAFNLGPVVDLHAALSADPTLIGADGLHPTAAGYQRMADTFFQAIVTRYDVTPLPQPVPVALTPAEDTEGMNEGIKRQ